MNVKLVRHSVAIALVVLVSGCGTAGAPETASVTPGQPESLSVTQIQAHSTVTVPAQPSSGGSDRVSATVYPDGSYSLTYQRSNLKQPSRTWYDASTGESVYWFGGDSESAEVWHTASGTPNFTLTVPTMQQQLGQGIGLGAPGESWREATAKAGLRVAYDKTADWLGSFSQTFDGEDAHTVTWELDSWSEATAKPIAEVIDTALDSAPVEIKQGVGTGWEPITAEAATTQLAEAGWRLPDIDGYTSITGWRFVGTPGISRVPDMWVPPMSRAVVVSYADGLHSYTVMLGALQPAGAGGKPPGELSPADRAAAYGLQPASGQAQADYTTTIRSGPFADGPFDTIRGWIGSEPVAWMVDDHGNGLLVATTESAEELSSFVSRLDYKG